MLDQIIYLLFMELLNKKTDCHLSFTTIGQVLQNSNSEDIQITQSSYVTHDKR